MAVQQYMSWAGGVDLAGSTHSAGGPPNLILHVARLVHTPVGSAPSGLIVYQPDPSAPPAVFGFVSTDAAVGAYFGPRIFAGTPFEGAPVLDAEIEITESAGEVRSRISVAGHLFETRLSELGPLEIVDRPPTGLPFHQQGLEANAGSCSVTIDGQPVTVHVPEVGISGGPGAVWSPCGSYAR